MDRKIAAVVAVVLCLALVCAVTWWFRRTDAATWELAPGQAISSTSTRFTAVVQQTGCNDGRTNPVHDPDIRVEQDRVVVTFAVDADRSFPGGAHSCPGGPGMRYEVVLPEPLGTRTVVDGTCPAYDADAPTCRRYPAPTR